MSLERLKRWLKSGKGFKCISMVSLLLISMSLCVMITMANYQIRMGEFFANTDNLADAELNLQRSLLEREMRFIAGDLRYLGRFNLMEQLMDEGTPQTMAELKSTLVTFASERNIYDQIRLLDNDGQEILRVECSNRIPVIIPDSELQSKHDRYYFQHAMQLRRGRMYVSPLDLNMEGDHIERPVKPTIRFAMGVYDSQGIRKGVLLLNYNAKSFLEILRETSDAYNVRFMLVNSEGFWVSHPDPSYEWGQFIAERTKHNFAKERPEAWQEISTTDAGRLVIGDKHFSYNTFDLQGMPEFVTTTAIAHSNDSAATSHETSTVLKHIAVLPKEAVWAFKYNLLRQSVVIGVIWLLLSMLPAWGLTTLFENRRTVHQKLAQRAHFDKITGIANREYFNDHLAKVLEEAKQNEQIFALLYIDLDGFKGVNDSMGHSVGDEILAMSAQRMNKCVRESDFTARLGGDEFGMILTHIEERDQAMKVGEKIVASLSKVFNTSKGPVTIGASLGLSLYPQDAPEAKQLMELADASMYEHKKFQKEQHFKFADGRAI